MPGLEQLAANAGYDMHRLQGTVQTNGEAMHVRINRGGACAPAQSDAAPKIEPPPCPRPSHEERPLLNLADDCVKTRRRLMPLKEQLTRALDARMPGLWAGTREVSTKSTTRLASSRPAPSSASSSRRRTMVAHTCGSPALDVRARRRWARRCTTS